MAFDIPGLYCRAIRICSVVSQSRKFSVFTTPLQTSFTPSIANILVDQDYFKKTCVTLLSSLEDAPSQTLSLFLLLVGTHIEFRQRYRPQHPPGAATLSRQSSTPRATLPLSTHPYNTQCMSEVESRQFEVQNRSKSAVNPQCAPEV